MKLVFLDTEYTGDHAFTTLVSVGLVTLDGRELYVTMNDYARDQVTDWLRKNVLSLIDEQQSVSSKEACDQISEFLEANSQGDCISLVSAGKVADLMLLFQLCHTQYPAMKYFHSLHGLPHYLNYRRHFDLDTLFMIAGIDPAVDRDVFVEHRFAGNHHDAIHDARVVRKCFLKLLRTGVILPPIPWTPG